MATEALRPNELSPPYKIVDELFRFRGYHDYEAIGVCRVRIFVRSNEPPVIVLTELPENETTSITHLAEQLWPEVIAKYLPHRFDYPEPAICIEHYPPLLNRHGHIAREASFDQVTFARWTPHAIFRHGQSRVELGEPDWHHLTREHVHRLIGELVD